MNKIENKIFLNDEYENTDIERRYRHNMDERISIFSTFTWTVGCSNLKMVSVGVISMAVATNIF